MIAQNFDQTGRMSPRPAIAAKSIFGILLLIIFGLSTPAATAQTVYGSMVGIVTDTTGAVVPGATVTILLIHCISCCHHPGED